MVAPDMPAKVAEVFAQWPRRAQKRLMRLRELVFAHAERLEVGPITETLKWGEPAYLTEASRSGTTIRLGWKPKAPDHCAVFFHCRTTLVADIRAAFGDTFEYEGQRAVLIPLQSPLPEDALAICLERALTYKRQRRV